MHLTIHFSPADFAAATVRKKDVCIVVDLIRATTTMAVLFAQGANQVFAADNLEQAQLAKRLFPQRLLCGERHAKPLPGFNYGNSPAQFAQLDLTERDLVLTTTNGTRAFHACPSSTSCLAGSFYNAQAVVTLALRLAQKGSGDLHVLCAGEFGSFALDDAVCAGYLASRLLLLQPDVQIHESVSAAVALYETYKPPRLLDFCRSARSVREAGFEADLDYCVSLDQTTLVPIVVDWEAETDLLIFEGMLP